MKDLIVDVTLWNKNVGSLLWDNNKNVSIFEFDDKFLKSDLNISPIIMPLNKAKNRTFSFLENRNNCFKGLPGLIADSLPDKFGTQILTEWYANKGLSSQSITPLDNLCYVGKRGMGALEFSPSEEFGALEKSSKINIGELTELARKVLNNREEFRANLKEEKGSYLDLLKLGTSAGGAKPKAIIAYNPLTQEVRSGQVKAPSGFGYYLLKFDGVEDSKLSDNPRGVGNIEFAYYKMATDCNIDMMPSSLLVEGNYSHFMTMRFDRTDTGEKIHSQTLAAVGHLDRDSRCSYEQAFEIMRRLKLPYSSQEQMFRRMVFNVLARNHDDHTKNHSFLMDKLGNWKLSPAYDICYSYSSTGKWTANHQLSLNGKRNDFTLTDFSKVAENMQINNSKQIIEEVKNVVSNWKQYAKDAGVIIEHLEKIQSSLPELSNSFQKGWEDILEK